MKHALVCGAGGLNDLYPANRLKNIRLAGGAGQQPCDLQLDGTA
jgi:hypothetical protein